MDHLQMFKKKYQILAVVKYFFIVVSKNTDNSNHFDIDTSHKNIYC
jgi:hypothetical protein